MPKKLPTSVNPLVVNSLCFYLPKSVFISLSLLNHFFLSIGLKTTYYFLSALVTF